MEVQQSQLNNDDAAWYLLQSKPRSEFKAAQELENQGYEVFLPVIEAQKIRAKKAQSIIEPLFSRYLFIRLNQTTHNWAPIRSTKGVSQIVRFANQPAYVSEVLVAELRNFMRTLPVKQPFQQGETVSVLNGPFRGLMGVFQKLRTMANGEVRAIVLIDILGKQQMLELEPEFMKVLT